MAEFDDEVSKVIDSIENGTNEDGFFIDDFDDLDLEEENSMEMNGKRVDFEQAFSYGVSSLSVEELKEVISETVKDTFSQIDCNKINYLVDVLEGNIGLLKQKEGVRTGNITPAKKNVPDIEIEMDYMEGLSCREIALKRGFTEDGIRKRLQRLGVYKSGNRNTKS